MKKKILWIFGTLFLVSVAVVVVLTFFLGSIVRAGVNRVGPALTKTRVELADARISPLSGIGTLTGFVVGNPEGWTSDRALYLGKVHVDLQPFSLFGDHIVINEILIDQPEFFYESRLFSSNLKELQKNIQRSTGGGKDKVEAARTNKGEPIRIEVRKFTLRNGKISIRVGGGTATAEMRPFELTDLGTKEGGLTTSQLAAAVTEQILGEVLIVATEAVAKNGWAPAAAAKDAIHSAGEGLKKILGGK